MIITGPALKAMFTGFDKSYQDGLGMAESQYQKIATIIRSSSSSNTYGWLGQWPQFREWIGDRVFNDMKTQEYVLLNKHFESSVAVNRDNVEDDNIGIYAPFMQEMGRAAGVFYDEQIFGLLPKGISTKCYDGQNFFDADHPVFPKVDGTGAAKTVSNYYHKADSGAQWFLMDTSRALKPMICQIRKDMKFTAMTDDKDEAVFMRNEFRYGVDGRSNVGFGFWQMASCSEEELSAENFLKVYDAMREQKADGGRPLGIRPTVIVIPPHLRGQAEDILKKDYISGSSNVNKDRVQIIESDWLA